VAVETAGVDERGYAKRFGGRSAHSVVRAGAEECIMSLEIQMISSSVTLVSNALVKNF
jgi:hypothetical protein